MNKPIATISRTNEILDKFNLKAKKGYGQNFIIEPSIVEKIAEKADVENNCVIEIGPGIGALTEQLCLRAKHVVAYEIDKNLIDVLAYSLSEYNNYEIRNEDFLNVDISSSIKELKKEYEKVVVCANLPYYITTPILFKLFESKEKPDLITVMIQKEVADRFNASIKTKDYNALSVITQFLYDTKIVMKIPRTIFNPKPNVDSAIIQFKAKNDVPKVKDQQEFFDFVKACFKQRRKTIYNNIKEYTDENKAKTILERSDIITSARAEELDIDTFVKLYQNYVIANEE